jgi:hypothetical protein
MADTFTPEQVSQIVEEFLQTVGTRQYIGARYVPIFGRRGEESIEWDDSAPYEPLTIVLHQGNSYTSRQYVPAGIPINNAEFWAPTGTYNAQIEAYRQEVVQFDGRITNIESAMPSSAFSETNTIAANIDAISDAVNALETDRYFTPEQFGAVGDGTTDDTSAIQAAINAAMQSTASKYVLFRANYRITDTLTIGSPVTLFGGTVGEYVPTINVDITGENKYAIQAETNSFCVNNLCIRCVTPYSCNCLTLIPPIVDVDCWLRFSKFFNFNVAVRAKGRSVVVENCNFSGNTYGLWFEGWESETDSQRSYVVTNCRFHSYGKRADDTYDGYGIYFDFKRTVANYVYISGNYCDRSYATFIGGDYAGGYVTNNYCCASAGKFLVMTALNNNGGSDNQLVVTDNVVQVRTTDTGMAPAITLRNCNHVYIERNTFVQFVRYCIELSACQYASIVGNTVLITKNPVEGSAFVHLSAAPSGIMRLCIDDNSSPTPIDGNKLYDYMFSSAVTFDNSQTRLSNNNVSCKHVANVPYTAYNRYVDQSTFDLSTNDLSNIPLNMIRGVALARFNRGYGLIMLGYSDTVSIIGSSTSTPGGIIIGNGTITDGVLNIANLVDRAPDGTQTNVTQLQRLIVL